MRIPTFTKLTRSYFHTDYLIVGVEGDYNKRMGDGLRCECTINRYCVQHLIPKGDYLCPASDMVECIGNDIFDTVSENFSTGNRSLLVANDSLVVLGASDFVQLLEANRMCIGRGTINKSDYAFEGDEIADTLTFIASAPPTVVDLSLPKTSRNITLVDVANYGIRYLEDIFKFLPAELQEAIPNYSEIGLSVNRAETACALMSRYMQEWFKIVKKHRMGAVAPTYSGQSMRYFRLRHYQNEIKPHNIEEVADLEEQCYLGGRAEARFEGKYNGKCYLLDVQSMYPAHALEKEYPVALADYQKFPTLATVERWLQDGIVFAHCGVKTDEPQFAKRLQNETMFPKGTFNTYLCGGELVQALHRQCINSIYFAAVYKGSYVLRSYAKHNLDARSVYKLNQNRLSEFITKFITNGLWGKFGQIGNRWVIDTETIPTHPYGGWYYHEPETGHLSHYRVINGVVSRLERAYYQNNVFTPISAIANSYGRDFLWRSMQLAGMQNVLYCCHDGLIVNESGKANLQYLITEDTTEYGKFKVSERANECYIRQYGVYRIGNKKCFMGMPRDNTRRFTGFWNVCGGRTISREGSVSSRLEIHKFSSPLEAREKAYDECIDPGRFISPTYLEEPELLDPVYHRANRQRSFPFAEWLQ